MINTNAPRDAAAFVTNLRARLDSDDGLDGNDAEYDALTDALDWIDVLTEWARHVSDAGVQLVTPGNLAVRVVDSDPASWLVECDSSGCTRTVRVPRRTRGRDGSLIVHTAPAAMRCISHPWH